MGYPKKRSYRKQVFIGPDGEEVWEVLFKRKIVEPDGICLGLADPSENHLLIAQGQSERETFQTWIHELLHSFEYVYGFHLPHPIIHKLEEAFADFYIHNLVKPTKKR